MEKGEVTRVHHIGVTVNDAEKTVEKWKELMDCEGKVVDIPENDLKIGVLEVADVTFFFNEITDPEKNGKASEGMDLPIDFGGHQMVKEKGEGISHIAFETTNLDYHMDKAEDVGFRRTRDEAKDSLEGICNFINPNDATLPLEFMQPVEGKDNPLE